MIVDCMFGAKNSLMMSYSSSLASGNDPLHVQLKTVTQVLYNVSSNSNPNVNWSGSYTSKGGTLLITSSFSCFSHTIGSYTVNLLVDGKVADTFSFYVSKTDTHMSVNPLFHVGSAILTGVHTIGLSVPSLVQVDVNDYCNLIVIEYFDVPLYSQV